MGVILCDIHGRQQIAFASMALQKIIDSKQKIENIYRVEIEYEQDIIDVFFTASLPEYEFDKKTLLSNLQKRAEENKPICVLCLRKYIESNSVNVIVERFASNFT